MDDLTRACFAPMCDLLTLEPERAIAQLAAFRPQLLLVESAWRGQGHNWQDKLTKQTKVIQQCLDWCRNHSVPTAFWNKEDPVHFGTFLPLAKSFDHIFTTDIGCIPRYQKALGHSQVSLLLFAAQPHLHNPLETVSRTRGFCFAGSWYQRYPARQRDFRALIQAARTLGPVKIFDRNFGAAHPENRFPEEYTPLIVGNLPFDQIERAYKGYRFALNVNTVKKSQTMFARRVFELIACNTPVVSNTARGMQLLFGDLVTAADSTNELLARLRPWWNDETHYRKLRLMALRKVLGEHTYTHRLEYICARIAGQAWRQDSPKVLVLAVARSADAERSVVASFARQSHMHRQGVLLRQYTPQKRPAPDGFVCFDTSDACLATLAERRRTIPWLAVFVAEDIYGAHYLTDLLQARHFSEAPAFGKVAHFCAQTGLTHLTHDGAQYHPANLLPARAALVRSDQLSQAWLAVCLANPTDTQLDLPNMLATDEFHYCRDGAGLAEAEVLRQVGDLLSLDTGLSLVDDILPVAENLTAGHYRQSIIAPDALAIDGKTLHDWLVARKPEGISLDLEDGRLAIRSSLDASAYVNLYAEERFSRERLNLIENNQVRLLAEHDLPELLTVFEFQDANKRKIGHTINPAGASYALLIPETCRHLRFALRLRGSGTAHVHTMVCGETEEPPVVVLEKHAPVVLTLSAQSSKASNMSYISRARAAMDAEDYITAIVLYEQAIEDRPELARMYQFNLQKARTRLGSTAVKAEIEANPEVSIPSGIVTLADLYREVETHIFRLPLLNPATAPPVSLLMTAHNVEEYTEAVITSAQRQTWPNLEIIVVDDASADNTWHILKRLEKTDGRLRCFRLNTNLGTYFAKNYALMMSHGDFVFFQDGDDLCHPERIRLSMQELNQPGVVCVQASYSRVSFPEGRVYPVNGLVKKLGLITLGLRKSVFDQIGYFNCTRKASDDELFQRLQAYCQTKGGEIRTLDLPLYYNTLREGSLFTDMINNDHVADGHIDQRPSPARAAYVDAFRRQQAELGVDRFQDFYRYPVLRDLITVAPDLSCLPNPDLPVVASLCSVPERAELLKLTLASLAPQVDQLHLYLDRYDAIPEIVRNCHPNLSVVLSRDRPGLRDNGKFLPFEPLKKECYYFTIDDDIIYPPDYVAAMIRKIDEYGRQAVIGVHGVLIPEQATCYFSGFRKVHGFIQALERDALVNILGTGTVAFHSGLLQGLRLDHFPTPGMTDLYLASFCKQRGIPMLCIARHNEWLIEQESPNQSLFAEYCQADEPQSALIRNTQPWGYAAICQAVSAVGRRTNPDLPVAHEKLAALMPVLHPCL